MAEANQRAFRSFDPPAVGAPVALFLSTDYDNRYEGVYWHTDWGEVTPEFEKVTLSAGHQSVMRPPAVDLLADEIKKRLDTR